MNMKLLFLFLTGVYYVHCIDVHCVNDDPFRTFRCPDGTYISDRLVCDGNEDCSEGYDEKFAGCNRNQKDMWTHKRHRVRGFWGKCEDSKPRNTGYEVNNIEECSSDKGKFLCHDNSRCLDQINKCDGFCNCFDCSDEDNNCLNSDEDLADTENSFNASDSAVTQLFYSIEKRAIKTMHISTNEEFIIKEIADDCTALTAAGDYVYYATDESIWDTFFDIGGHEFDDYHECDDAIRTRKYISRFSLISHETFKIIKSDDEITSISIDYITNNVYFTTSSSLSVCSNCGRLCQQLKSHDSINSVRLAPRSGLMFWISSQQVGESYDHYLMKSSMDGSNEKRLIRSYGESLELISVDELNEKLYFYCKGSQQIKTATFDGDEQEVYWSFYSPIHAATIFKEDIFFINEQQRKISRIENTTRTSTIKSNDAINKLVVYNPLLYRTKVRNPCMLSCTGLCLTRPSSSRGILNHTCLNHTNYEEISMEKREETATILGLILIVLYAIFIFVIFIVKYFKRRYRSIDLVIDHKSTKM